MRVGNKVNGTTLVHDRLKSSNYRNSVLPRVCVSLDGAGLTDFFGVSSITRELGLRRYA